FVNRKPLRSGSGSTKSKSPCLPGFFPVMKLDQAQGVMGGIVDSRGLLAPKRASFASQGRWPCSIQGSIRSNAAPSRPRTRIRYAGRVTRGAPQPAATGSRLLFEVEPFEFFPLVAGHQLDRLTAAVCLYA